ncbi:Stf0 family sulfotransferase, partial [Rhizobium sp.]|uniref:Stf0 family sulfotransferase n=1 Tax=Rhizobium sp. TaxID=391 RepID=UPI000E8438BC|nr:sulfotransferase [Rhizobium sp.]
ATGISGNPGSYFHVPSLPEWLTYFNLRAGLATPEKDVLTQVFAAALSKGRGDTDIFGLRLQRHSFDFFLRKLAILYRGHANDVARIEAAFGKTLFIYLTRPDKVEQAVSCVKALQTGLWHVAPDGTEMERQSPPQKPIYSPGELRFTYNEFVAFELGWQQWFDSQDIQPFRITYDALSADPIGTLKTVLRELGLNANAANGVVPEVAKLADATNQDWARRFRTELGAADASPLFA